MTDFTKKDRLSNLGYMAIGKEATKGVPVTPDVFIPLYEESMTTNPNLDMDSPIMGNRFARYFNFQGQRDHQGVVTVMGEPKTLPHLLNMILKKGSTTDADPIYTHPYTLDNDQPSEASYTIEIVKDGVTFRFYGVEISKISPIFENNTLRLNLNLSALCQFSIAPISSASGSSADNVTLATDYDKSPNTGAVAGDTLVLVKTTSGSSDTYEEVAITAVNADGIKLSTASIVGTYTTGDYCYIKKQTASYSLGEPLKWSGAEFRFGDTALAALSATQIRVEQGSTFNLLNNFEDDAGAKRSGDLDPAALVRTMGDIELTIKKTFKDYKEYERFISIRKRSVVIRMFGAVISGTTRDELRITINNLKIKNSPAPLKTGEIIYLEQEYSAQYDPSDAQGMDVKVVNDDDGSNY